MILSNYNDNTEIPKVAGLQIKAWEQLLSFRISLQRSLDIINKYPAVEDFNILHDNNEDIRNTNESLLSTLGSVADNLVSLLEDQVHSDDKKTKKRVRNSSPSWERLSTVDNILQKKWQSVVNKQYSRLHFGSDELHSKMKVINKSLWDQAYHYLNIKFI